MQIITYGFGGYDETKPDNNVLSIETIPDPEPSPIDTAIAKFEAMGFTKEEAMAIINGGA